MSTIPQLNLAEACEQIRLGHGVAFPTPCGYGWALDPFHDAAVARIALLKPQRSQPVGLIAADLEQVRSLVELPENRAELLGLWPAELSLIMRAKPGLPELICSAVGGVSLRIPEGAQARALAQQFGAPLTATSLNRSGEAPLSDTSQLAGLPDGAIAGFLPGRAGTGAPSTLVDLLGPTLRVLRPGPVDVLNLSSS